MMDRKSKRFQPSSWSEKLVPVLMALVLLALLITLAIVALSILGLTPAM